jgi:SAM-dependent methyltransferase
VIARSLPPQSGREEAYTVRHSKTATRNPRWLPDKRRAAAWSTLWRHYFSKLIPAEASVLDLGCGQCDFINSVVARRRIALDIWPDFPRYVAAGIEAHVGSVMNLEFIDDGSIDFAFAINLFEHITQSDFASVLAQLRTKLSERGTLVILQPNYRYAYRQYFDDYTHIAIYSHISLSDFLVANNYDVLEVRPRFLPLTVKSSVPVWPFLIRAYLNSPVHPMAKQMLVRAKPLK